MSGLISKKCYYGIKALFDLARRETDRPVRIGAIAERQHIPIRFLEAILRQLKQAGWVDSRRGSEGGYFLIVRPTRIKLIEVIMYFEGDFAQLGGSESGSESNNEADYVLIHVWKESRKSLAGVLGRWTIADMVEKAEADKQYIANFNI